MLERVEHSTEWVNSFVIVEKDVSVDSGNSHAPHHQTKKKLQICLDPRDLNEALECDPYYSRSVDELIGKFHGCKVFSIVDMKKGYWMVILHPDSRPLTCMSIDIGRFQWTQLPMGTLVASDVFQKKPDEIFHNVQYVTGMVDDMIIYGKSIQEHDKHFLSFISMVKKNNLKLNALKLQFQLEEVSFFGHNWSSKAISPDPKKILAIQHIVFPPDKESMQSSLVMINFLNRYSPRLVELSISRQLCRLHAGYKPESEHYQSFNSIKKELSTKIVLPYYDPASCTTLQTDSSKKGLGAIPIQNGTPIYFASRAISATESNYQNPECETLGTIWGMEKSHYFLYGNKFTLETDQKQLVSIYRKHLVDVSPRIQRLIIRALPYNFHIVYVPGKLIQMADALCRNLKKLTSEDEEEDQISSTNTGSQLHHWILSTVSRQICNRLNQGGNLQRCHITIADKVHQKWLAYRSKETSKGIAPLMELSRWTFPRGWNPVEVIQNSNTYTLWMKMLDLIHEGHQGIEKCLLHSRESLFWSGICNEICQTVDKCRICQATSTAQRKLPSVPSEIWPHAWHTLGTDLFYWKHFDLLVLGDYFSKFLIERKLWSSTSSAVCKEISNIFTEFGKPYIIRSDNGPCYASKEFKELMELFQVQHVTSQLWF